MKKRRRIVLMGLLLALLALVAWFALRPREPMFQGQSLSWWLRRTDAWLYVTQSRSLPDQMSIPLRKQEVTLALRQMGTNVLPHLVEKLTQIENPTALRRATKWINERQNFVKLPIHDKPPWSEFAAEAFRLLGTNAQPAIPELEKLLQDEQTSFIASDCLISIGLASVPAFIRALTNTSERVRIISLQAIGDFGPAAWDAIPFISEIARGTNAVSCNAIRVLSEVDTNCVKYLPLFESRLFDTNYPLEAAFALGRMGTEGMPLLLRALTNQSKQVRIAALAPCTPQSTSSALDEPTVRKITAFAAFAPSSIWRQ